MDKKMYYHYTRLENLPKIMKTKTLESNGGVYACDSFEDLSKFTTLYVLAKQFTLKEIVGIEFTTDAEFEESFDHNPELLLGAKAFVSYKDVHIDIVNVFPILDK